MPLLSTDNFLVDRGGNNFRMPASEIRNYLHAKASVSDIAPQNPEDGDLWYQTTTGELYVWSEEIIPYAWIDVTDPRYLPFTTGTYTRTLNDKLREVHSVKDYGAVGDGVTDDTEAIQIAVSTAVPGGSVYFPSGNYRITERIEIPSDSNGNSDLIIYGNGMNSSRIVTASDQGCFYSYNCSNITIMDLRMDLSNDVGIGIWFSSRDGDTYYGYNVVRCAFDNAETAIRCEGKNVRILSNVINDSRVLFWNCARNVIVAGNQISMSTNPVLPTAENTGARAALHFRRPNSSVVNDVAWTTFPAPNNIQVFANDFTVSGNANIAIAIHGGKNISIYDNKIDCSGIKYYDPQNYRGAINAQVVINTGNIGFWSLQNLSIYNNEISTGSGMSAIYSSNLTDRLGYHINIQNNIFSGVTDSTNAVVFDNVKGYLLAENTLIDTGFDPVPFSISNSEGSAYNNASITTSSFTDNTFYNSFVSFAPLVSSTSPIVITNPDAHQFITERPIGSNTIVISQCPADQTYTGFILGLFSPNTFTVDRTWRHCTGSDALDDNFIIYGNGDVQNRTGIYGGISDIKVKENIRDVSSQWEDIARLRLRSFKWEDDRSDDTQLGLIAQEVQRISPGVVVENEESGLLSINYSVIHMKAFIALQELMNRVEILENDVMQLGYTSK
jgi:hypothetical protein